MRMFNKIGNEITKWKASRRTRLELHRLTDRELSDIGIHRCDIDRVVRESYQKVKA